MTTKNLKRAMAERCYDMITKHAPFGAEMPESLRSSHLESMCARMLADIDNWDEARFHRWIGFIQGGLMANRVIDIEQAKSMFDRDKSSFASPGPDLIDHLDLEDPFEFDLGGEG